MIIYLNWQEKFNGGKSFKNCDGWYLFGFIPLYVRKYIRNT